MSITISAGVRQNLSNLQQTADLQALTQNRLATGKKVNSALDNPNSFFTAKALESRAGDLSSLLDDMGQAIQTVKAADEGIKAISKLVESAKAKANQALASSSSSDRDRFAAEYNEILSQIEGIAKDSSYKGKNLLQGGANNNLKVIFNEKTGSDEASLSITAIDYTDTTSASGLNLADIATTGTGSWGDASDGTAAINTALTAVNAALSTLRSQASTFGTNLSVVENRQSFTRSMMSTLQAGADRLTLADSNEEGAKLLSLNTRQQLSSTALSFASQADQNVLRLF